jgi:Fe-S cluster biogenesis protein NfuA
VAHDAEFQEKIRQLGDRIGRLDQLPQSASSAAAKEVVQLLMDLHGAGLERILEVIFESGEQGQRIIDKLGQDPLAGSLLLLYSLHPDDLETRVHTAVERMRPRLRKLSCTLDTVQVRDGAVEVSLTASGHGCGSSAGEVRSIVEEMMYELAPDLTSLEIRGIEQPAATGFVPLDSLLGKQLVIATHSHGQGSEAAD